MFGLSKPWVSKKKYDRVCDSNARLKAEVERLSARLLASNNDTDACHEFIGELSKRVMNALSVLEAVKPDVEAIRDAWTKVGCHYPWDERYVAESNTVAIGRNAPSC